MSYIKFKYIKLHEVFMDMYIFTGTSQTKIIKICTKSIYSNLEIPVVFRGKMIEMYRVGDYLDKKLYKKISHKEYQFLKCDMYLILF